MKKAEISRPFYVMLRETGPVYGAHTHQISEANKDCIKVWDKDHSMCYLSKNLDSLFQCTESLHEVGCKVPGLTCLLRERCWGKLKFQTRGVQTTWHLYVLKRLVPLKRNLLYCTKTAGKEGSLAHIGCCGSTLRHVGRLHLELAVERGSDIYIVLVLKAELQ